MLLCGASDPQNDGEGAATQRGRPPLLYYVSETDRTMDRQNMQSPPGQ